MTGTYGVTIQNAATGGSRVSYVSSYTINSANTWEFKTVTVTPPTTYTWYTDTQRGLGIIFSLGSTGYSTSTLNQWQVANKFDVTGAVDLSNNSGATLQITGVQYEVGDTATSFEHRSFVDELRRCQRYYYQVGGITNDGGPDEVYGVILPHAMCASSTRVKGVLQHPVNMRDAPSISGGGSGTAKIQVGDSSGSSYLVYNSLWGSSNSTRYTWTDFAPNSGSVSNVGESGIVYANNSTYHLKVSAEL